ncbi:MAG: ATP-binding protein [Clostridia bacterium]|nr:ATP-binding protein [Clostridia bacterium]
MKKIEMRRIEENKSLLNILTPIGGIEYKVNRVRIGDYFAKIYTAIQYPNKVDIGWLSKITNIPNTICSLNFEPTDNGILIQNISKGISQNEKEMDSIRDEILRQRTERELEDARELITRIDQNGEVVGYMTVIVMVISEDEEDLLKRCKRVESKLMGMQMKIRSLANLVKNAFKSIAPFFRVDKDIKKIANRNAPFSSFIGGLPFASSGFNDQKGYYFAKDTDGGIVVLDTWKRGGDRTNSNFVIMGTAGVGKSTVAKHLILNEYMTGTRVICIDPEGEYKEITENLDGDWLNVGNGQGGIINPLQIKDVPLDDDDEDIKCYKDEGKGLGAMALHFQTLRTFFKLLFPELTSVQTAILEETLEELYNNFGIYWNTNIKDKKNTDFPIMSDLYSLIEKKIKIEKDTEKTKEYEILKSLIRTVAIGADSGLFNGHTSIKTKSKMVCLDTHNLQNASDKVKKAQYFNILTYCWELMSKDKTEKTMLVCDEAYLLIDTEVPQSLIFLRNVAKRCRKYEGSLVIISHSIVDFLDPSVKMYGQAILDMATYKILMGTDGKNLEESTELFKLSESQYEFLYKKKRAFAILIIGAYRILVKFDIFQHEFEFFGKGGGR